LKAQAIATLAKYAHPLEKVKRGNSPSGYWPDALSTTGSLPGHHFMV
jgi:hypothetical protein